MYTMFTFESVERQTVCVHIKLDPTDPHKIDDSKNDHKTKTKVQFLTIKD